MTGERHEPEIETYAIGQADKLTVDVFGTTYTIQFDRAQVQDQGLIRYYIEEYRHGLYFDTEPILEGAHVETLDR